MTIAQIKALFQTKKIPTQADFENLISKIPNDDLTGRGDNTLILYNPSAPHVWGYRFVTIDDNYTYIFLGVYDASGGNIVPFLIIQCNQGRPLEGGAAINWAFLTDAQMIHIHNEIGDLHSPDDTSLVNAIPSDIQWNRMNSNPTVRVICTKGQESDITFQCFPAKYNNKFYVGYVIKEEHSYNADSYWRGVIKSGIAYNDIAWDNSDEDLAKASEKYPKHTPFTKESLMYREIFSEFYPGYEDWIIDFWMPNPDWVGADVKDPSARVLSNYGDSGK